MTPEEIDALARRIVNAFRGAADIYEEQTDDSRQIRTRYDELKGPHSFLEAACGARMEWLRGVLAEAIGREEVGHADRPA